jgi:hypothetical protein
MVRQELSMSCGAACARQLLLDAGSVMLRDDDLPHDLAPFEFAIDFDPTNMVNADPAGALVIDPHGLSGSPVWRIGASGLKVNAWKPELSTLVGFVTAWQEDKKLLRATLVAPVLELLQRSRDS